MSKTNRHFGYSREYDCRQIEDEFFPFVPTLIRTMFNSKCMLWLPFQVAPPILGTNREIAVVVASWQVEVCKMRHAPHTPDTSYSPSMSSGVWSSRVWLCVEPFCSIGSCGGWWPGNRNCWNCATKDVSTPSGSWVISCDAYTRRDSNRNSNSNYMSSSIFVWSIREGNHLWCINRPRLRSAIDLRRNLWPATPTPTPRSPQNEPWRFKYPKWECRKKWSAKASWSEWGWSWFKGHVTWVT